MIGIVDQYVTDYGVFRLKTGWVESRAESMQKAQWNRHEDDLIGVPEVHPDNNALAQKMQAKAKRMWIEGEEIK